jgi:hypothetical protein
MPKGQRFVKKIKPASELGTDAGRTGTGAALGATRIWPDIRRVWGRLSEIFTASGQNGFTRFNKMFVISPEREKGAPSEGCAFDLVF